MRRISIVSVAVLAMSGAALVACAQKSDAPAKAETVDTYSGSSNRGLQPALDEAVQTAMKAHGGVADAMIEWELVKVTGRQGGIAGFNETTVTIRVTAGTPKAAGK